MVGTLQWLTADLLARPFINGHAVAPVSGALPLVGERRDVDMLCVGEVDQVVAITDRDWFDFLAAREDVDEVNFWQPSTGGGRFRALGRGEPFLFKLRAPVNAIVGGGFFEHHTTLPFSLAWRAFGPKNGTATQQAFRDRIERLRRTEMAAWEDPEIGCILLVEPFFWPRELWIPQPADWKPRRLPLLQRATHGRGRRPPE